MSLEPIAKIVNGNLLPHFDLFLRPKSSLNEGLQLICPDFCNWLAGQEIVQLKTINSRLHHMNLLP